ncbi:MAG: hypothetical protein IID06_01485 [Gemmatimonadetes bacterium]|nr:hypothetical protein [Gemmatimonadota bacterium]
MADQRFGDLFRKLGVPDDLARAWQWLAFAGAAMLTALTWAVAAVRSLPWPAQIAFGVAAFIFSMVLLSLVLNGLRVLLRRIGPKSSIATDLGNADEWKASPELKIDAHALVQVPAGSVEHLAGVLHTMISNDSESKPRTCIVTKSNVDTTHWNPPVGSGYIDFIWNIYSGSVFDLVFTEHVENKVYYSVDRKSASERGHIRQAPELIVPPALRPLRRTFNGDLKLRQYLPTEVLNDLRVPPSSVIFDFSEIRFVVAATSPDGHTSDWRIVPPPEWDVQL